jgi:hypothetical protein
MADVSHGPVNTLPGSRKNADVGTMCDQHPDRPAVRRVQGETDSFGAEYYDLCNECLAEHDKYAKEELHGACDWCGVEAADLRPRRDIDEGMCGRVYRVCGECVRKDNEQLEDEIRRYDDEHDYDD